jgi:putative signal transducing protein
METVFHASTSLEAHLVQQLLERAGLASRIDGEFLQGGAGELPPGNLIRVRVEPQHAAEAREIIAEWEKGQLTL